MANVIRYSTAGLGELLVAVPEPRAGLLGTWEWQFKETSGIRCERIGEFEAPEKSSPTFDHVTLYRLTLLTQEASQEFNMVRPMPIPPEVHGHASMASHPIDSTSFINATLPVGGALETPLCIAVRDSAGSTGYHWTVAEKSQNIKMETDHFPKVSAPPGAPGFRFYYLTALEEGNTTFRLELRAPNKALISQVHVAFTATPKEA